MSVHSLGRFHKPGRRLQSTRGESAFTLIEVIVAASILAGGLLTIVQVFPYGIQTSRRAEDVTQATLLAQTMFEGLKTDPINFPIIPGLPGVLIPIPGNGYDDDTNNQTFQQRTGRGNIPDDLNRNGRPDVDYDGLPERDGLATSRIQPNGVDDDGDGVIDDNGESGSTNRSSGVPSFFTNRAADGNLVYDPEPNMDEELPNGKDDDRDGFIDEDVRLASLRLGGRRGIMLPLLAGDGMDNDGDGLIDEEVWDGEDNDGDGRVDEDTQLASFPVAPARFSPPNNRYGWMIRVGTVPNNGEFGLIDRNGDGIVELGDGIDNDGDGLIDEELPDGLDNDFPVQPNQGLSWITGYNRTPAQDGLVDEDAIAAPLPNWRRVEIVITWGGDGVDNDEDGNQNRVDPSSRGHLGDPGLRGRFQSRQITYNRVDWSVDEEKVDGIDNDLDGEIDEDVYSNEFVLVGFLSLEDPSQSFTLKGGQPRGMIPSALVNQ